MKSIKEKAKEYDRVVERISANKSLVDVSGREQFEAGANYVLDAITDVINQPMNDYLVLNELKRLIKQLKK